MNPNWIFENANGIIPEIVNFKLFNVRRRTISNLEYICTPISSVLHNQSDIRIAFGYTDMFSHEVRVFEYLEGRQFFEVCKKSLRFRVNQSQWIPLYPELLAVAANNISIFDYQNRNLSLRINLLSSEVHFNPIISMDWNRRDPRVMLATAQDGKLTVMNVEYGRPLAAMKTTRFLSASWLQRGFCARFGRGLMENSVITLNNKNEMVIFDDTLQQIRIHEHINGILGIELAKHNEFLIAFRTENQVFFHDLRCLTSNRKIFSNFQNDEVPKCFCWSPNSFALYIGTSKGGIIEWNTQYPEVGQRYAISEQKPISNIHVPDTMPNILFTTSAGLPGAPFATQLEAYSIF